MDQEYVDGFVIPMAKDKIDEYRRLAEAAAKVWMDHGALSYRECIGDDLGVKMGIPFTTIAGAQDNETIVFAWITYRSREDRDRINDLVMKDPRLKDMGDAMPFDCNRMTYGGFKTIVAA